MKFRVTGTRNIRGYAPGKTFSVKEEDIGPGAFNAAALIERGHIVEVDPKQGNVATSAGIPEVKVHVETGTD